jgi:preprotein translocase subunit SecE
MGFKDGKETRGSTNVCVVLVIVSSLFWFIINKVINYGG